MRHFITAILIVTLAAPVLAPSPAWAQKRDKAAEAEAEEHSRLGVEYYDKGQYKDAIREMLAAYQIINDPGLLYNIARIYQKMGEDELALDFFTRFVKEDDAEPDRVQKALEHIQAIRDAKKAAQIDEMKRKEEAERKRREALANDQKNKGNQGKSEGPDHTVAFVVGGLGAAALITGGVMGMLAVSAQGEIEDESLDFAERLEAQNRGQTLAILGDVGLGLGIAGLAAGAVLYFTADAPEKTPQGGQVDVAPLIGAEQVGVNVLIHFE